MLLRISGTSGSKMGVHSSRDDELWMKNVRQLKTTQDAPVLVFYENYEICLWNRNKPSKKLISLGRSVLWTTASGDGSGNRLVIYSLEKHSLLTYDLCENLKGTVRLKEEAKCNYMCLSENGGDYLFLIDKLKCFLYVYRVSSGKQIEKLYIEKLVSAEGMQATKDNGLIINVKSELMVFEIRDKPN
ncbi:unnamed protein product, partial [Didymodactylos carnosus]